MVEIKQHYVDCLAQASYAIYSEKEVFIIDPRRDVDQYIDEAKEQGAKIIGVMLTHLHADFVAGHRELARRAKAPLYIGKNAGPKYDFTALTDGMSVTFGKAKVEFLETPGHTPGDITAVLFDLDKSTTTPVAAFTGDTLFNGDVGRPDLLVSFGLKQRDLADMLYDTLHNKIMKLPDETVIYPGHGEGSLCGKSLASTTITSIKEQKEVNYALKAANKDIFFDQVKEQPRAPKYFLMNATMNINGPTDLSEVVDKVDGLEVEQFAAEVAKNDIIILDTRDGSDFAKGYVPGSINISLDGQFAVWAGIIVDLEKRILVVCDDGDEQESITRLARVGLENIAGYLKGGFESWAEAKKESLSYERLHAKSASEMIEKGEFKQFIDIRNNQKIANEGTIAGAKQMDLLDYFDNLEQLAGSDKREKILLVCSVGFQTPIAISLLQQAGYTNLYDINGGVYAWTNAKLPIT
jgi:hydroxyacylglutathione hydrolase